MKKLDRHAPPMSFGRLCKISSFFFGGGGGRGRGLINCKLFLFYSTDNHLKQKNLLSIKSKRAQNVTYNGHSGFKYQMISSAAKISHFIILNLSLIS